MYGLADLTLAAPAVVPPVGTSTGVSTFQGQTVGDFQNRLLLIVAAVVLLFMVKK